MPFFLKRRLCPRKRQSAVSLSGRRERPRPATSFREVNVINAIDAAKCTGCGTCYKTCGLDVFRIDTDQNTLSPCMAACPAGTDIRAWNALMQEGKIAEAAQKLKEKNPFPAITGRVCPHACESECSRSGVDGAVNINALEQFLGDYDLHDAPRQPSVRHLARVAVAGSGPAGLSCAWFLASAGYPVTVFEALPEPGGMLRWGIPAYRLPGAVIEAQVNKLKALGVRFMCNVRIGAGGDISLEDLKERGFRAVCVAPGTTFSRRANVPGEELRGVFHGVEFLRAVRAGRGGGTPVPPDFPVSGTVLVIGGGDVAMDAAITAKLLGAAQVRICCLEAEDAMPAFPHNIADARARGVDIEAGWGVMQVNGKEGRVCGLTLKRCLSVWDGAHAFRPVFDENDMREIEADAVIFAIGQASDLSFFPDLEKASSSRIKADPVTFGTSVWNVFAAGDAVTGPASVIRAIAGGREAAISIDRLMQGAHLHSERDEKRRIAENLPGEGILTAPRSERAAIPAEGFRETRRGLDVIDALNESMRCMTCGAKARVTFRDDCMTCFFCELRCPNEAIDVHPFKERLPYTIESNTGGY